MSPSAHDGGPYDQGMSEPGFAGIRISDTERESALTALGEHLASGRLGVDEYGDRSARVSTTKTRGELLALFADLPEPHPTFGQLSAAVAASPAPSRAEVVRPEDRWGVAQRVMVALVSLSGIAAVVLFFTVHTWLVFLLPVAISVVGGAIWGDDWDKRKRHGSRQRRRELRG